jgi:hypothetical protein
MGIYTKLLRREIYLRATSPFQMGTVYIARMLGSKARSYSGAKWFLKQKLGMIPGNGIRIQ